MQSCSIHKEWLKKTYPSFLSKNVNYYVPGELNSLPEVGELVKIGSFYSDILTCLHVHAVEKEVDLKCMF